MALFFGAILGVGVVLLADRLIWFVRWRYALYLVIDITADTTRIFDRNMSPIIDSPNVVMLARHGRRRTITGYGLTGESTPHQGPSAIKVHLVRDALSIPIAELEQLWEAFLVYCIKKAAKETAERPWMFTGKIKARTENAQIDRAIELAAARRSFRARGTFAMYDAGN